MTTTSTIDPGLRGVVVAETAIGDVQGDAGFFHYRGFDATDLAASRTFEDVWRLVLDGSLPRDDAERHAFAAEVRAARTVPTPVLDALAPLAAAAAPADALRAALPLLGAARGLRPLVDADASTRRADAVALAAAVPTLLAALHRRRAGQEPIAPRADLGHGANYLWMLTGEEPDPIRAAALEQYLVLTIDHGFNASTFTARVVASTGADLAAVVTAGLAALSGPLHGGAPSRALDLLDEVGAADRIVAVLGPRIAAGETVMGFGHAVYRTDDPRSVRLRALARSLHAPLAPLAEALEREVVALLDARKPGRNLRANVELYAGVVMDACGVPRAMFTPTFAVSRVVGWTAHALEQAARGRIIRPAARYCAPAAARPAP